MDFGDICLLVVLMGSLLGWSDMSVVFPQRKICHTTPSPCPVSLPTLSLPTLLYKSLLTFMSSCFIVWSIDFSQDHLCDHKFRTGHESLMGSPLEHHWRKWRCFLHRAFIPPFWGLQTITAIRQKEHQSRREMLSSGHTLYKQSHSSCSCMQQD